MYVLVFVGAAIAVYQWGRLRSQRTESDGPYTATAVVRWQATPPAENADHDSLPLPLPQPTIQQIERRIASEENVQRALDDLNKALAPSPGKNDRTALEQTVAEVRQNLRAVAHAGPEPGRPQVSITCTQPHTEDAILLVNTLAEHWADDYRAEWKAAAQRAFAAAQDAAQRAHEDFRAARACLDAFYQQHLQPGPGVAKAQTPAVTQKPAVTETPAVTVPVHPAPVENPEWTELHGQLEELQRRRTALLESRTPLHPAVKDVELRLADVTELLATRPRWMAAAQSGPQPPPANRPPAPSAHSSGAPMDNPSAANRDGPAPSEGLGQVAETQLAETHETFEKLKRAVDRADQARDAAARRERQAWQATLQEPQIEVEPAVSCERSSSSTADLRVLLAALASALVATAAVHMLLAAAAPERTLTTLAEVEALLPVPVVGVIPAALVAHRRGPARRRLALRAALFAGSVTIVALWAGVLLLFFGGN